MSKTIAIIEGLDTDLIMIASRFPSRGETLGGKGANSAIATYRTCHQKPLEHESWLGTIQQRRQRPRQMIGAVGDDRYGEKFIVELNKNSVDTSGIVTVPDTRSSICFVMVENLIHENRCLFTLGATATWKKEDFFVAQMEIDKEILEAAIMSSRGRDEEFLNCGAKNVVITLGAKGAFYANATGSDHCPAFNVKVEDPTGAG
ncbi:Ribokinase-like protein [Amylocarpus encephaloides]|uniref:Ribokinase-like protein n=1 Tax=Amylocarpus encephaloides TaxID=45428 RepID=A0A9P8C0Y2_9HELO|nr:Ribokinase-like protein [Amylocarpus encephaloides]